MNLSVQRLVLLYFSNSMHAFVLKETSLADLCFKEFIKEEFFLTELVLCHSEWELVVFRSRLTREIVVSDV